MTKVEKKYLQRRPIEFDRIPKEIREESIKICGSETDDLTGKSLNPFEPDTKGEAYVMKIQNISKDDPELRQKVDDFWRDMAISVPAGSSPTDGYELNVSVKEDGTPMNLRHWVQFEWLRRKKNIFTLEQVKQGILDSVPESIEAFVLVDPDVARSHKMELNTELDKAMRFYQEASNDEKRTLVLLQQTQFVHKRDDVENLTHDDRILLLREVASNMDTVIDFNQIASDPHIMLRYFIDMLVTHGTLRTSGNAYWDRDRKIGEDKEAVIDFLLDEKNHGYKEQLKDRLKRDKSTALV